MDPLWGLAEKRIMRLTSFLLFIQLARYGFIGIN